MSASRNPESVAQHGEFHSRVPPSAPLTTKGHKPGVLVGNDKVPEFHAETYPPGTAPQENTFQPRPESEFPAQAYGTQPDASETLGGATSQDLNQGLGKPIQGQLHREAEGAHAGVHRKKERTGLVGTGGSVGVDSVREKGADLPEGVHKGMRGKASDDYPPAEERVPTSAEELAADRKAPKHR
ncbi:hypothetical protein F5Y19DRAFT_399799 [Xylariaceae sp. FL1651]|nr:hypothetical protein F5Y19DRAFT_399799 [Xylariaceae sp. FL1651]